MSVWQPIETAPKDGTFVLVCGGAPWPDVVRIGAYRDGFIWMRDLIARRSSIPTEWEDVAKWWTPLPEPPARVGQSMTPAQRLLARHALGLPNDRKRSHRNRYIAPFGTDVTDQWISLVEKGLGDAIFGGPQDWCFYLTAKGAALALDPGESLCPEDFPEARP